MSYFTLQAGTGTVVPLGDLQDNWFGVVNQSGAAGFFYYLQNGVAIGSITSSQRVVTNNGADFNYVSNQVAALLNSLIGPYSNSAPLMWFNDQKDSPPGSYLDVAYYAGMEIWTNDDAIAHFSPGKSFTQSTIQSSVNLPNQPSFWIAGALILNIPPM